LTILEKIAKHHKTWVRQVISFGCKPSEAEDVVQNMYLKVNTLINSGLDITFDDDINKFYIYRTLKSLFYDTCRKEAKIQKVNIEYLEKYIKEEEEYKEKDVPKKIKEYNKLLDQLYWYDRKVWELTREKSIAEVSKLTNISYYSLYNTVKGVKKLIKEKIEWDLET
tara:strand:+ start:89 stop:589 length:501 start_codon:yes stop_codon:yes gene_type:complete